MVAIASETQSSGEREESLETRRSRYAFLITTTSLVVLTLLVFQSPPLEARKITGLIILWVILGYASYFAAAHAYGPRRNELRPHLRVGRGIPAWIFFLGGGSVLLVVSVAEIAWGIAKAGVTLSGVSIIYLSLTYPRPLSIRRAALPGVGLLVAAVGLLLF